MKHGVHRGHGHPQWTCPTDNIIHGPPKQYPPPASDSSGQHDLPTRPPFLLSSIAGVRHAPWPGSRCTRSRAA